MSRKSKIVEEPLLKSVDEELQIRIDVERLSQTVHIYWALYGTELGKKVVNVVGARTFGVIQRTFQEALVMGVARLLFDKPKAGPHENMPLELLIRSGRDKGGPFNVRLQAIKQKYADIVSLRNKIFAHRDRATHTEYVRLRWGQESNGHDITFMEREDLFILEAAEAISKLTRDWYKQKRGVKIDADDPKDVTELLEALDAGQSLLALLRYLPGSPYETLAGQQKDSK